MIGLHTISPTNQPTDRTTLAVTKDCRRLIGAIAHLTGVSLEQVVVRSVLKYGKELSANNVGIYDRLSLQMRMVDEETKNRYGRLTSARSQRMKRINTQRLRPQTSSTIVIPRQLYS